MDKTQEEKFQKWFGSAATLDRRFSETARSAWDACLEANVIGGEPRIPDWYFKIGEDVEVQGDSGQWNKASIGLIYGEQSKKYSENANIRRIAAWKPKEGEVVLVRVFDVAEIGYVKEGFLWYRGDKCLVVSVGTDEVKPFDAYKVGKLWSDI